MNGRDRLTEKYGIRTVWAIDDFIDHAEMASYLVNLDFEKRDELVYSLAIEAVMSRLGESVNRMGAQFIADYPELGLRKIVDNRNLVAHEYHIIVHEVISAAFEDKLPPIVDALQSLLT